MNAFRKVFGRMRGSAGKSADPDPRIRWFGKVPARGDYVAPAERPRWAQEFAEWMLAGWEACLVDSYSPPVKLHEGFGLVRMPDTESTVIFVIRDMGGDQRGRSFPLALFCGVPTKSLPGPTPQIVPGLALVIRELMRQFDAVARVVAANGVPGDCLQNSEVNLTNLLGTENPAQPRVENSGDTFQMWFEEAITGADLDAGQWQARVEQWGAHLAAMAGGEFEPTLGFPLARTFSWEQQVVAWLSWLNARLPLAPRNFQMLVSSDPDRCPYALSIVGRFPVADDMMLLTSRYSDVKYVDHAASQPPGEDNPVDSERDKFRTDDVAWTTFFMQERSGPAS
ncbi:MAG: hypothetical protein AB7N71_04455 [Phycisphaerae bacterium]